MTDKGHCPHLLVGKAAPVHCPAAAALAANGRGRAARAEAGAGEAADPRETIEVLKEISKRPPLAGGS